VYFKYASTAAILQVTSQKAAAGSSKALQAMGALSTLGGTISADCASTPLFSRFGSLGPVVQLRQATYPIASIGQLMTTLGGLQTAP